MSSDLRDVLPITWRERGFIDWICTSNPFYVLSAGLFLAGLYISFGAQTRDVDTWALMSGLTGYTLLLATAAFVLVRFGNVWDDVRTVLLLVVLMFLATSVTFDEVLVINPLRGFTCYLGGLLLSVAVTEIILRGIRLRLPVGFRLPYYLSLALFFLYPLALYPLLAEPQSEGLMWALFGFASAGGVIFLTLLPAIRRGPAYTQGNGSPWPWPFYPWSLFVFLGVAICGRAWMLCWSMQHLEMDHFGQLIFSPYFLFPFGLAVAMLLLEIGLVGGYRRVQGIALSLAAALVLLPLIDRRGDVMHEQFLGMFLARIGGYPLFISLLAVTCYFGYASLRGVRWATEALTVALIALAFVGPETRSLSNLVEPYSLPILAALVLQLGLGLWRHSSWRCLVSAAGFIFLVILALPPAWDPSLRGLTVFHLALLEILIVGAAYNDTFAQLLRAVGGLAILLAIEAAMFGKFDRPGWPWWAVEFYPLAMAILLAVYGWLLGHGPSLAMAILGLAFWLTVLVCRGYLALRQIITGLDYLVGGLFLFALAMRISLRKSKRKRIRDA